MSYSLDLSVPTFGKNTAYVMLYLSQGIAVVRLLFPGGDAKFEHWISGVCQYLCCKGTCFLLYLIANCCDGWVGVSNFGLCVPNT